MLSGALPQGQLDLLDGELISAVSPTLTRHATRPSCGLGSASVRESCLWPSQTQAFLNRLPGSIVRDIPFPIDF